MNQLENLLHLTGAELAALGYAWALVGGLAVSVRAEPRFTRDIDLAVALDNDEQAETLVRSLRQLDFTVLATVEQEAAKRLATVRLSPDGKNSGVIIDLLFASSGIEPDIVRAAERLEIVPGLYVPVAQTGHLIALKVLARDDLHRPQDLGDLRALLNVATPQDRELARASLQLIEARGYQRNRNLMEDLEELLSQR